jgi:hypothetical protein
MEAISFSEMLGCLRTNRRYIMMIILFIDVIEVHQTGFRPNVSPTDKTFYMTVTGLESKQGRPGPSLTTVLSAETSPWYLF